MDLGAGCRRGAGEVQTECRRSAGGVQAECRRSAGGVGTFCFLMQSIFCKLRTQLRHSLVVHPVLRKILDLPLTIVRECEADVSNLL